MTTDTNPFEFSFSARAINARRRALGIPRERVALHLHRSAQTVANWETGKAPVPDALRAGLLDVLGFSPDDYERHRQSCEAAGVPMFVEDPDDIALLTRLMS